MEGGAEDGEQGGECETKVPLPWGAATTAAAELDLNAPAQAHPAFPHAAARHNQKKMKKVVSLFGVKLELTDDDDDDETIAGGEGVDAAVATTTAAEPGQQPQPPTKKRRRKRRRKGVGCLEERQRRWEAKYAEVKAWAAEHGGQLPSATQSRELYAWLHYNRSRWGWPRLGLDQIDKLAALGVGRLAEKGHDNDQPQKKKTTKTKKTSHHKRLKVEEEPMAMSTTTTTTTTTATTTTTTATPPKPRRYVTWAMRFEELRAYRELHVDRPLPAQHESPLGAWLHNQRYRVNTGRMTNEHKIAQLTALGVALSPPTIEFVPEIDI